jgi:hypothetical protein
MSMAAVHEAPTPERSGFRDAFIRRFFFFYQRHPLKVVKPIFDAGISVRLDPKRASNVAKSWINLQPEGFMSDIEAR